MAKTKKQAKKKIDSYNLLPDYIKNSTELSDGAKRVLNTLIQWNISNKHAIETGLLLVKRDVLREISNVSPNSVKRYTSELEQINLISVLLGEKETEDTKRRVTCYKINEERLYSTEPFTKLTIKQILENRQRLQEEYYNEKSITGYYNIIKDNIIENNIIKDNKIEDINDKVIEVERTTNNTEDNDQLNNNFINNINNFDKMVNDSVSSKELTDTVTVESETVSSSKCIEVRSIKTNTSSKSDECHDQASLNQSLFINREIIEELGKDIVAARRASDYWKEYVKLVNAAWEKANKRIHELQGSKGEMVVTFYEALYTLNEETTRFNHVLMPSVDEQKVIEEEYLKHLDNPKELLAKANQEKNLRIKLFVFKLKTIKEKTLEILTSKLPTQ